MENKRGERGGGGGGEKTFEVGCPVVVIVTHSLVVSQPEKRAKTQHAPTQHMHS